MQTVAPPDLPSPIAPHRRLLVCPKGMNQSTHLSVYLDSPEAAFAPPALNPTASFTLTLINQLDRAQDFHKGGRQLERCAGGLLLCD